MPMSSESPVRIPIIDLSRLDLANPHGQEWEKVSAQVMSALESIGCFEAVFDRVSPEDLEAIFDIAAKDLFTLPLDIKMKNTSSNKPQYGYISDHRTIESFKIDPVNTVEGRNAFAQLMWPEGNPTFCKTVEIFGKHLPELAQMIARMVLEKLGIQNYFSSYTDSSSYSMRIWKYATQEPDVGLPNHLDTNLLSIVCQNRVAGLDFHTRNGDWIPVVPSTKFVVIIGECFTAFSNGRLEAPVHRVKLETMDTRYSLAFDAYPRDGCTVETPKEMVDEEHPLLFKPFEYVDYLQWRLSEQGKLPCLKKYCGNIRGSGEEVGGALF